MVAIFNMLICAEYRSHIWSPWNKNNTTFFLEFNNELHERWQWWSRNYLPYYDHMCSSLFLVGFVFLFSVFCVQYLWIVLIHVSVIFLIFLTYLYCFLLIEVKLTWSHHFEISLSQIITNMFRLSLSQSDFFVFFFGSSMTKNTTLSEQF